jgi:NAD+ dependent glucose-6-phosphate dehydrogenase
LRFGPNKKVEKRYQNNVTQRPWINRIVIERKRIVCSSKTKNLRDNKVALMKTILITGAAGVMGKKLSAHLQGRFHLRLLDRNSGQDVEVADLSRPGSWMDRFEGVDTVVHFAADPEAFKSWNELVSPNVDSLIYVYQSAIKHNVRRVIFASSNHVMGGYQDDKTIKLSDTTLPKPGLRYRINGISQNSTAYAMAKLFGERLGECYAASHGLETLAIRFGWIWRLGPNEPQNLPAERGEWFRQMWLSDRDYL